MKFERDAQNETHYKNAADNKSYNALSKLKLRFYRAKFI
jgi:hypothetical protein